MGKKVAQTAVLCFEIAGMILFGVPLSALAGVCGLGLIWIFTLRILVKEIVAKWRSRPGEHVISRAVGLLMRIAWLRLHNFWLRAKREWLRFRFARLFARRRRLEEKLAKIRPGAVATVTVNAPDDFALRERLAKCRSNNTLLN